jgi:dihydroxy-acid dehydratase
MRQHGQWNRAISHAEEVHISTIFPKWRGLWVKLAAGERIIPARARLAGTRLTRGGNGGKCGVMSEPLSRPHSSTVVDGPDRAASRAMLHAVGFKREDFAKPKIGIASTWSMVTPCNMHIDKLAEEAGHGADAAGGKAVIFGTITVSDGISMGTEGMKYSLVSREIIADSIEAVVGCEGMDGFVAIGGCDKNMPGCVMAMARLNRPSVFVYGGTILPGCHAGQDLDIVSYSRRWGATPRANWTTPACRRSRNTAIPGAGSCGGMYTANTMASAIEALGMSLPNSSAQAAISDAKKMDCFDAGAAVVEMLRRGIRPSDILCREAFENAITLVTALGGSTNAVLHLLAIAHTANIPLELEDFARIGARVPVLGDLKPSGRFFMNDLVRIGGTLPLMRRLLDAGMLHGGCLTVTGRTLAENLAKVSPDYPEGQEIIRPFDNPVKKDGHLVILRGNLAPGGAVAKISGKEGERFSGRARVFEGEEPALAAILRGDIVAGDVIVIRREGPQGGPGMREMLSPTSAVMGRGLGKQVALITDGRFSGGSHGFVVGHITPEAHAGGPLAVVQDDDTITIDARARRLTLDVEAHELERRMRAWQAYPPRYTRGALAKFAKLCASASEGAVTDRDIL